MRARLSRVIVAGGALAAAALLATAGIGSTGWIGTVFPGFFVVVNRVVPSVALPAWSGGDAARLFQQQVTAVDGAAVERAEEVYALVRRRPPGTPITYTLRARDGAETSVVLPSRVFSSADWVLLFGAILLTGFAFVASGALAYLLKPDGPASRGLLCAGLTTGLFLLTAPDLYGPFRLVRLHVLGECLASAGFLHLALVFPTEHLRRRRRVLAVGAYALFGALAVAYELALGSAPAYTALHLLASAGHGLAILAVVAAVLHDWVTSRSALVRRRIGVVTLGALAAFLLPMLAMGGSALLGGRVPVNVGAFTAFLFPLSLGYAIVKKDLFEIDVLLRRATTYAVVVAMIAGAYLAALAALGGVLAAQGLPGSPVFFALLNLGILLVLAPVRARVQRGVDRLFFRRGYQAEEALSGLGQTLAAARTAGDVAAATCRVLDETVCPVGVTFLLADGEAAFRSRDARAQGPGLRVPPELVARLAAGELLARYEWEDERGGAPPLWQALGAELLVPVRTGGALTALLALAPRASGTSYTIHDVAFLRGVASQVALGLTNAHAFERLEALNQHLEALVGERTAALEAANRDLGRSLAELRAAYDQLERNQASLVRADRLATLGRLTAGLAHSGPSTPPRSSPSTRPLRGSRRARRW